MVQTRRQIRGLKEEKLAINIFPEEIWLMIFNNLSDSNDLWNCSKSCQLFHQLLHPSKPTFLFSQVFPFVWKGQTGREILECRSVCKSWKRGADHYLENPPCLRPHGDIECKPMDLPFLNPMKVKELGGYHSLTSTSTEDNIERWEGFLEYHKKKDWAIPPFIGRAFTITYNPRYDEGQHLHSLLSVIGKHVWYLTVQLENFVEFPLPLNLEFLLTREVIRSVPNLRKFRLSGHWGEHIQSNLNRTLDDWPSTLETFEVESSSIKIRRGGIHANFWKVNPHSFQEDFLRNYHNQLRKLHVNTEIWRRLCDLDWPKLVELHVTDCDEERISNQFEYMRGLPAPGLKKLGFHAGHWKLIFQNLGSAIYRDLNKWLDIVGREAAFQELDCLRIRGPIHSYSEHLQVPAWARWMSSKLKTLELDYYPKSCYSFLCRFHFLENLNLVWKERCCPANECAADWGNLTSLSSQPPSRPLKEPSLEGEIRVKVDINEFIGPGQMYKSNVWEMLPYLKVLTVQWEVYTREGYDKFKRKERNLRLCPMDCRVFLGRIEPIGKHNP